MAGSSSQQLTSILKVAVPVIAAVGIAAYVFGYFNPASPASDATREKKNQRTEGDDGVNESQTSKLGKDKKQFNLITASREDVIELLNDVLSVQKQLSTLMDSAVERIAKENLDLPSVYNLIFVSQPQDPLDSHGLSIADFDALLDRFGSDKEVHSMVLAVIKGPDTTSEDLTKVHPEVKPDRIIEINQAMKERLREAADELKMRRSTLPAPFNSRTASLTAQAIVGAFVRKEFDVTADDVERAMVLFQYELSQRPDFMKINDEIQEMMHDIMNSSE